MKSLFIKLSIVSVLSALFASTTIAQTKTGLDERDVLKRAHVFHIMLTDHEQLSSIFRTLQKIPVQKRFEAFKNIARSKSIDPGSKDLGGDLGVIRQGTMVQEFEDELFAQPIQKVSKPIRSRWGWHLLYLDSVSGVPIAPLCQNSLPPMSASMSQPVQRALKLSQEPYSIENIWTALPEILGEEWGVPLVNTNGDVEFSKLERAGSGAINLISHIDHSYTLFNPKNYYNEKPTIDPAPAFCVRATQLTYSLDCKAGKMYYEGYTSYELRGGLGRIIHSKTNQSPQKLVVETVSRKVGELIGSACINGKIDVEIEE